MPDDWNSLKALSDFSVVAGENIVLCLGLATTLYFRSGHTEKKRRAVIECFNEYEKSCGEFLRWWVVEGRRPGRVSKLPKRDMSPYLLSPGWNKPVAKEHAWAFLWHGGERYHDASPIRIEGFGPSEEKSKKSDALSYLRVSFPIAWFSNREDGLPELVLRWSERLDAFHGYGGIALIQSTNDGIAQMHGESVSGIAMRYPGVEIDDMLGHAQLTKKAIKGGSWLTVLSDFFVEKLGGARKLREALGAPFAVWEYPGGAVIVAGAVPEVGDNNAAIDTPIYRRLAKVLKPIRIHQHYEITEKGALSEPGSFEVWLARFDD